MDYWYNLEQDGKSRCSKNSHYPIISSNKSIVSQIEGLVDKILAAHASINSVSANTQEWERKIDRLMYRLYNLTDEEIKIVEKIN